MDHKNELIIMHQLCPNKQLSHLHISLQSMTTRKNIFSFANTFGGSKCVCTLQNKVFCASQAQNILNC